ncbi:hypothetical protein ACP70R_008126 [Stipagrostis hirtigluma subsp. patula]
MTGGCSFLPAAAFTAHDYILVPSFDLSQPADDRATWIIAVYKGLDTGLTYQIFSYKSGTGVWGSVKSTPKYIYHCPEVVCGGAAVHWLGHGQWPIDLDDKRHCTFAIDARTGRTWKTELPEKFRQLDYMDMLTRSVLATSRDGHLSVVRLLPCRKMEVWVLPGGGDGWTLQRLVDVQILPGSCPNWESTYVKLYAFCQRSGCVIGNLHGQMFVISVENGSALPMGVSESKYHRYCVPYETDLSTYISNMKLGYLDSSEQLVELGAYTCMASAHKSRGGGSCGQTAMSGGARRSTASSAMTEHLVTVEHARDPRHGEVSLQLEGGGGSVIAKLIHDYRRNVPDTATAYTLVGGYDLSSSDDTAAWIIAMDLGRIIGVTYQIFSSTSGAGAWGPLKRSPECIYHYQGVVCHGTVYRLGERDNDGGGRHHCVFGIDVRTGRISTTELPKKLRRLDYLNIGIRSIMATTRDGRLSVVSLLPCHDMEVWVLTGGDRWTLQRAIDVQNLPEYCPANRRPDVFCPRSGCVVSRVHGQNLLIDVESGSARPMSVGTNHGYCVPYEMDLSTFISRMKHF